MASIVLDDEAVTSLHLSVPHSGAWVADVQYVSDVVPTGQVVLSDGTRSLQGFVVRAGEISGLVKARIIGGRGGLIKTVPAKSFRAATLRNILSDTLTAAGETLSHGSSSSLMGTLVQHWTRIEGKAAECIGTVTAAHEALWRVNDDGSIWVGLDTTSVSESTARVKDVHEQHGFAEIFPDGFDLQPGTLFEGRLIRRVAYSIHDGHLRGLFWWQL